MAAKVQVTNELEAGLQGPKRLYTDVWASMGQEHEAFDARAPSRPYQLNIDLMTHVYVRRAPLFLHCLRRHRDEEVTRRGDRVENIGSLRPGGEPVAHAKGSNRNAAGGLGQQGLKSGAAGSARTADAAPARARPARTGKILWGEHS